ncbi:MAG: hypothetical protein AB8C84_06200 [Oligoflexales bacterium]
MRVFALLFVLLQYSGCDESGKSIGAPAIYPPVEHSTPAGLLSTALTLTEEATAPPTAVEVIKGRLFSPGPTNFSYRLQKIDERMASLNSRAEDSPRKCVDEVATEWTPPALPNGDVFPMYFQCQETLSETSQLAFGFYDDHFYLMERGTTGSDDEWIIVYAKANTAGTEVEFWQIAVSQETVEGVKIPSYAYTHVKANETTGALEFTNGGNSAGNGVSCGIQMKSNANYMYASGIFGSPNNPPGEDCSGTQRASETICVNASDLTVADSTNCATLASYELKSLTHTITEGEGGYTKAEAISVAAVSGYTEFND